MPRSESLILNLVSHPPLCLKQLIVRVAGGGGQRSLCTWLTGPLFPSELYHGITVPSLGYFYELAWELPELC